MAAGDLITTDWEVEFRDLLLGGDTDFSLVQVEGLVDIPDLRTGDQALLRRHGLHPGDDFLGARTVTLTFEVYGDTEAELSTNMDALQGAFRPGLSEEPLVFQLPGVAEGNKAQVYARCRRRQSVIDRDWYYRLPLVVVEMVATDPRVYANTEDSVSADLPSGGAGLTFNATFSLSFGGAISGGALNVTNDGTFPTPVAIKVEGPVTNPRITNTTLDKKLELDLVVADGDYVILDSATRTILLNGTASRYSSLTDDSEWWDLAPGVNAITYRASTATSSTITLTARSAWA